MLASTGNSFHRFFDNVDKFFGNLAAVQWGSLALGLVAFGVYLSFRSRASYNIIRAAYPAERFR